MDLWDWEPVKKQIRDQRLTQEIVAERADIPTNTFRGQIKKNVEPRYSEGLRILGVLGMLENREFLVPSGKPQQLELDHFDIARIVPQKLSAGPGQELTDLLVAESAAGFLPYSDDELIQRAPYPQKWGKGLLAVEVLGDSMTGVQIFDADIVYFRPGEIRGNGLYVLQINGQVFVKRLSFDAVSRKVTISSENPKYPEVSESLDSQAITILGKVRGWLHEHPY